MSHGSPPVTRQAAKIIVPERYRAFWTFSTPIPQPRTISKVTSQTDETSGEQITYSYDALNRLATAVTTDNPTVTQWGQSYTYGGFRNLTDQNVIKGSAPTMRVAYSVATNRQTGDTA